MENAAFCSISAKEGDDGSALVYFMGTFTEANCLISFEIAMDSQLQSSTA
jgi:hypothetical protein